MKKLTIGIILLCILHSILLVNQPWGINVVCFMIPLIGFILYMMKENKLIKNKAGLLFLIPIILLSITYFVYDNTLKYLNILVIPILYFLFYIFTIKPVKTIGDVVVEVLNLMVKPLNAMGLYTKEEVKLISKPTKKMEMKKKDYKVLKALLVVIPIVLVVLLLLASADSIFGDLFLKVFKIDLKWFSFEEVFTRIFFFILLFFYLGSTIFFLKDQYLKEKRVKKEPKEKDPFTLNLLLICLNVIYVVFDIIQINSLMLHRVASGFNYADYARSGFFQLMLISFINITIILLSKKCKEELKSKLLSILMVILTFIIIYSSYLRMSLYEAAYGYTVLRLGVYAILLTEAILLLPTIYYIINKNLNIMSFYVVIPVIMYSVINCFSVDQIIAENNIKRYERTGKIDLYYLQNTNYDNLNQLRKLNKMIEKDDKIKEIDKNSFRFYIGHMDKRNDKTIFGYNLSKENARKQTTWKPIEKRD